MTHLDLIPAFETAGLRWWRGAMLAARWRD
jgi:hypothetical protein